MTERIRKEKRKSPGQSQTCDFSIMQLALRQSAKITTAIKYMMLVIVELCVLIKMEVVGARKLSFYNDG